MVEFDVLIENASIIDGTGKKEYEGSIGVKADKVVAVGDAKGDAVKTINSKASRLCPAS
jgi:N-acyl-D-aspartate/D-glutamate deacylase